MGSIRPQNTGLVNSSHRQHKCGPVVCALTLIVIIGLTFALPGQGEEVAAGEMPPLGLIGGTSWRSTVEYYQWINQGINDVYGNNTNPPLVVYTLNQRQIHDFQLANRWDRIADILTDAAIRLRAAGATAILFCANTPYKLYAEVSKKIALPILHIGDAIGMAIQKDHLTKVGLIGTKYTMEDGFIADWLHRYYGIEVLVPTGQAQRNELHRIVQKELGMGVFSSRSKEYIIAQIDELRKRGATGIVLGCTEFSLIIAPKDVPLPVYDSARLHADMAVAFLLKRYTPRPPM
jgi:aspartate racemase